MLWSWWVASAKARHQDRAEPESLAGELSNVFAQLNSREHAGFKVSAYGVTH